MLLLTSTNDKIQLITSAACAVSVHAAYVDKLADVITPLRTNTLITTATTTDIVPSPAASTERNVQMLAVVNTHASTAVTVTVQHTDGTSVVRLYQKVLQPGEELFVGMTTLLLTSATDKLRLVSAGAALSLGVYVAFVENDAGTITPGRQNTLITTATTTDILASPAAAKQRNVQFVSVFNAHATESATISITHTDGTTEVVVFRAILLPGQAIRFVEGDEFKPASVVVSATAPIGVEDDVLWWNSTTGALYVLYNDGSSTQWVQAAAPVVSVPASFFALDNGKITFTVSGNNLTAALKTLAGADPSSDDPVRCTFADPSGGGYSVLTIATPQSVVVPNGGTMAVVANTSFKVYACALLDGTTFRLAVTQRVSSGVRVTPLQDHTLSTSLAVGTGSDSAGSIYSTVAVSTPSPMRILAFAEWGATVLATPGAWASNPDLIRPFGPGVHAPGSVIAQAWTFPGSGDTGTTTMAFGSGAPTNSEGKQFMSRDIVLNYRSSLIKIEALAFLDANAIGQMQMALFRDSVTNALVAGSNRIPEAGMMVPLMLKHFMIAAAASHTFNMRAGLNNASTYGFNLSGGVAKLGGTFGSHIEITEIMS